MRIYFVIHHLKDGGQNQVKSYNTLFIDIFLKIEDCEGGSCYLLFLSTTALWVWPWLPSWQMHIVFCPKLLFSIFSHPYSSSPIWNHPFTLIKIFLSFLPHPGLSSSNLVPHIFGEIQYTFIYVYTHKLGCEAASFISHETGYLCMYSEGHC
jgi:hypothetical protein